MAARFGGNANNGNCSPRNLNANNAVNNSNRNNCGLALCGLKKLGIFFLIFPRSGESIKDKRMRLYDKNMIEMRDGRKPVISPQLKSVSNYIDISLDDIREACEAAFKNHSKKE